MNDNKQFNDLYAFVQVAKLGSFSKAAQALNVQPSALSHRISDLEGRLKIKLLNRTTRAVSTTEAGSSCSNALRRCLAAFSRSWVPWWISPTKCAAKSALTAPNAPPTS